MLGVSQLLASLSLCAFCLVFAVAARLRLAERAFGGLDKAYIWHKWLGIAAVVLVMVHKMTAVPASSASAQMLGNLAMLALLVLTAVAMFARRLRHEAWKHIHKAMAVPYAIGLVHYYAHSTYGALSWAPLSMWLMAVNAVGVACAVYAVVGYQWLGFGRAVDVVAVNVVARGTAEIACTPRGRRVFRFRPGQFVFVKGRVDGARFPAHPFTVSGAGEGPGVSVGADGFVRVRGGGVVSAGRTEGPGGTVSVTVKALGRHTEALVSRVQPGDMLRLSRAYGRFDPSKGGRRQIWVAGGIGIAPFRACVRGGDDIGRDVDLFYAFDDAGAAPHLAEVESWGTADFRVHLLDRSRDGLLTAARMAAAVGAGAKVPPGDRGAGQEDGAPGGLAEGEPHDSAPWDEAPQDIYFCGPPAMLQALREQLPTTHLAGARLHYEEFSLGRPQPKRRPLPRTD
jgi:predicted ferric reductase